MSGCEVGVHRVDLALQPLDLGVDDAQGAFRLAPVLGRAEVGAEIEQVVLDARQHGVGLALRVQPGDADDAVGLVDGAVGGDAQVVLRDARPSPSEVSPLSPPRV